MRTRTWLLVSRGVVQVDDVDLADFSPSELGEHRFDLGVSAPFEEGQARGDNFFQVIGGNSSAFPSNVVPNASHVANGGGNDPEGLANNLSVHVVVA